MSETNGVFSVDAYADIVRALLDRGYTCVEYREARPDRRHLILRHDVDMSLEDALAVAKVEGALGVAATYFVLMRSELYNPFAPASKDALRGIQECGHRIGLHFDASLYPDDLAVLETACGVECELLASACGAAVDMVSFHRPSDRLLRREQAIAGRAHAYQPAYFTEIGYCSDSRGAWHHGHPLEHASVKGGAALQLLTHPIWWTRPDFDGPVEKLDAFLARRSDTLSRTLADNCEPYRVELGNRSGR